MKSHIALVLGKLLLILLMVKVRLSQLNDFRERIERFIDENKALMKRMYGDFEMTSAPKEPGHRTRRRRKSREASKHDIPDGGPSFQDELEPMIEADGDSFFANIRTARHPRQSPGKNRNNDSGRYVYNSKS